MNSRASGKKKRGTRTHEGPGSRHSAWLSLLTSTDPRHQGTQKILRSALPSQSVGLPEASESRAKTCLLVSKGSVGCQVMLAYQNELESVPPSSVVFKSLYRIAILLEMFSPSFIDI